MSHQIERVTEHFDSVAKDYDKTVVDLGWMGNEVLCQAFRDFPRPTDSMLDLCSGTGNTIATALKYISPRHIQAVDTSQEMLDRLRMKYPDVTRIAIARQAIRAFMADDSKKYGLITCIAGFQLLEDQLEAMARQVAH